MMRARYDRHAYPFHHVERPQGERMVAALARYDARMKEQAMRERKARLAVHLVFVGIGIAIAARLAYWTDISAIFSRTI